MAVITPSNKQPESGDQFSQFTWLFWGPSPFHSATTHYNEENGNEYWYIPTPPDRPAKQAQSNNHFWVNIN